MFFNYKILWNYWIFDWFFRYVPKSTREKYGLGDLSIENSWNYILKPKEKLNESLQNTPVEKVEESPKPTKPVNTNLITKFTKVLTEEEYKKSRVSSSPNVKNVESDDISVIESNDSSKTKPSFQTPSRKKVSLISVPLGQSISSNVQKTNSPSSSPKISNNNSNLLSTPTSSKSESKLRSASKKDAALDKTPKNSVKKITSFFKDSGSTTPKSTKSPISRSITPDLTKSASKTSQLDKDDDVITLD